MRRLRARLRRDQQGYSIVELIVSMSILASVMTTVGPLINNAIYSWSIDHHIPSLVFFWTAAVSLLSIMFVSLAGFSK